MQIKQQFFRDLLEIGGVEAHGVFYYPTTILAIAAKCKYTNTQKNYSVWLIVELISFFEEKEVCCLT